MAETSGEQALLAGRYRLIDVIGRGGMGVVWHARDELIDRDIAVKQIHPPLGLGEDERAVYRQRALSEARNAGRISHAGVVAIHDIVPAQRDGDAVCLVMELIAAPTLEDVLTRDGPLSPDRVLAIARGLREALETAHAMGIVHRDIKPANIHLLPGDTIKLVDFGIAHTLDDPRLTHTGTMGTGPYMAPELFDGEAPHARSDWWSLGVTLRHLVTGENMFARQSPAATMRAIVVDPIPPAECPTPLSTVIDGLLNRDPDARLTGAGLGEALAADATPDFAYTKGGTAKWPTGPTRMVSTADDPLPVRPDWRHHDSDLARAWIHGDRGDFATAIAEFTRLALDYAREFGDQHRNTLVARYQLALWRGETENPFAAAAELESLLGDVIRKFGPDDWLTLDARRALTRCLGETYDPAAATGQLEALLPVVTENFGPDDTLTLDTRHALATARGDMQDERRALAALTELLSDSNRILGSDHPATLHVRHDLMRQRATAGDAETAINELEQVLQDRARILGPAHPHTFATRQELAIARGGTDPHTAVTELERLTQDMARSLGSGHIHTLQARSELAEWRGKAEGPQDAVVAFEQLWHDSKIAFGADSPSTFHFRGELAKAHGLADGPMAAVAALERLVHDEAQALGADHVLTLMDRVTLAEWRGTAEGPQAAITAFQELQPDAERALGAEHAICVVVRAMPAIIRLEQGDLDFPIDDPDLEQVASDFQQVLGSEHFLTVSVNTMLILSRAMNADDPAAVVVELEEWLAELRRVLGDDGDLTFAVCEALAVQYRALGDISRAIREHEDLRAGKERTLGADHPETLSTRRRLADCRGEEAGPQVAVTELQAVLYDQERVLGADDPDTLSTRGYLAYWRGEDAGPRAAIAGLEALLPDLERVLGADHEDTRDAREALARWEDATEKTPTSDSIPVSDRIAILEEHLADAPQRNDHLATLIMRHELACLRGRSGDAAAAVADLEGLLPDMTAISNVGLGDMLWVFSTRHELARYRAETGDLATAITELESLLRDQENAIGAEHPRTLMTRDELAYRRGDSEVPHTAADEHAE